MTNNFAGEPPVSTQTVQQPANSTITQIQATGPGGAPLAVNSTLPAATALTQVVINATANGDNTLVAGTASKSVKVYQLALGPASVAVNGIFKSGSGTAISGTMALSTTQTLVLNFSPYPWLRTNATDGLVLNLSTTASVGGFASVVQS